jgi:hypothetical protein
VHSERNKEVLHGRVGSGSECRFSSLPVVVLPRFALSYLFERPYHNISSTKYKTIQYMEWSLNEDVTFGFICVGRVK